MTIKSFKSIEKLFESLHDQNERAKEGYENVRNWKKELKPGDYAVQVLDCGYGEFLTVYAEIQADIAAEDEPRIPDYLVWIRGYSEACPNGELGSIYRDNLSIKITKQLFEQAKAAGWPHISKLIQTLPQSGRQQ